MRTVIACIILLISLLCPVLKGISVVNDTVGRLPQIQSEEDAAEADENQSGNSVDDSNASASEDKIIVLPTDEF